MPRQISKNSFKDQTIYIGIDVHKKNWKVTILLEEREHKCFSMNPCPEELARYLHKMFPGGRYLAVYEAGFSGFNACRRLIELGIDCRLVHAADVPTSQKEKLQKSDKADSRKLARTLRNKEFSYIHIPDEELEADRSLVRQRYTISKEVARTKNRVKSLLFQYGIQIPEGFSNSQTRSWSRAYITWLTNLKIDHPSLQLVLDNHLRHGQSLRKQLLLLNKQLRVLAQKDRYRNNYALLLSIPGVGPLTAILFLVEIGNINRFKKLDQLCNFIGLVPRMYGSGDKMVTGKIIRRGRKKLKIALIEASWKAIGADPALMLKFEACKSKMHANKAIIRIARKLLARMRYVLKNTQPYELGIVE